MLNPAQIDEAYREGQRRLQEELSVAGMEGVQRAVARDCIDAVLACVCDTGPNSDGPSQECPQHGDLNAESAGIQAANAIARRYGFDPLPYPQPSAAAITTPINVPMPAAAKRDIDDEFGH